MNSPLLDQITEAVLYEGYALYPYRPSSIKNQRERFTFGRVYPEAYSVAEGGAEPCIMQTECIARAASQSPQLRATIRFLQPVARQIGAFETPLRTATPLSRDTGAMPPFRLVPQLRAGGQIFQPWLEAVERSVTVPPLVLSDRSSSSFRMPFAFPGAEEFEPITEGETTLGVVCRTQDRIAGLAEIEAQPLPGNLLKLTIRMFNHTPMAACPARSDDVLLRTFASTHTVLALSGAEFVSSMDPPAEAREAVNGCVNIGTWPVLVGDETSGQRDLMLSSPIILYDYPKIAPESAGPLFDGTEIDEILTLRIQTLAESEKDEMRRVDPTVRRLLERTEALPSDSRQRLHGVLREPASRPAVDFDDFFGPATPLSSVTVNGVCLQAGDRVRIRPKARADIMDLALQDQVAIIEAVEQDLEKKVHLAVVFENDPGKDLGLMRQSGHRFFYGVDEVEPVRQE
jgi:hypothetical protein